MGCEKQKARTVASSGFVGVAWMRGLLPRGRQIRAAAVRHLGRHADALAQRGVRVNRQTAVW